MGNSIQFQLVNACSCENVIQTENDSTQSSNRCWMLYHMSCWPRHFTVSYFGILALAIYVFMFVKSACEISSVHEHQHSFSTHKRILLRECQRFGDRKYLDPGGFESPSFNSCRIFYYSCCQGQTFAMSRFGILALVVCIFLLEKGAFEMSIVYSIFKMFVIFLT